MVAVQMWRSCAVQAACMLLLLPLLLLLGTWAQAAAADSRSQRACGCGWPPPLPGVCRRCVPAARQGGVRAMISARTHARVSLGATPQPCVGWCHRPYMVLMWGRCPSGVQRLCGAAPAPGRSGGPVGSTAPQGPEKQVQTNKLKILLVGMVKYKKE